MLWQARIHTTIWRVYGRLWRSGLHCGVTTPRDNAAWALKCFTKIGGRCTMPHVSNLNAHIQQVVNSISPAIGFRYNRTGLD